MIREQSVLLKIIYDDTQAEEPAHWDWPGLLGEEVKILEVDGQKIGPNRGNLVHNLGE